MKCKSSLETFWKWWYLVYKAEVRHELSKDTIVKILDVSDQCPMDLDMGLF